MLELKNLSVTYPDGTRAVDGVSLTVRENESVALIGANGAGKTSLMLSLVGVLPIHSGSAEVDDIPVDKAHLDEVRRRIGLVLQNPDDQLFMPVIREDVAFGPHNFGLPHEEIDRIVSHVLETLHISHLADRSPLKLSGGEKRMAAIATILSMDPSVMLFDEPTAFLDPQSRRNLIHVLKGLSHTKLIATHDLSFAAETCDRVVILRNGAVAEDGAADLLYDQALMARCGVEAIGYTEP